jgi:tetratricopeptide (TPR) repeat protein
MDRRHVATALIVGLALLAWWNSSRREEKPAVFCRRLPPYAKHSTKGAMKPLFRPTLLIVGLALLAWWNSFAGSFQFDDFHVIVDNPDAASLAAWWHSMPGIRPLLKLSYALNRAGPGGDHGLFGFHLVNLALHFGDAFLLHALLRRLLGDAEQSRRVALLAALLYLVHPVQSEAVTLISGRSMSLMALFYLGSLLAWLDQRRWLSLAAFAAALATRETAITLPLALYLVERMRSASTPREVLRRTAGHWLLAVLAASALLALPSFRHLAQVSRDTRPLFDNLISQAAAQLYLLGQVLWPVRLDADPQLPRFTGWNGDWVVQVSLYLCLLGGALFAWRGQGLIRWSGFCLLWFFLHLAPTNSLLPRLDLANERHLYLADAGLCLLAALWLERALHTRPRLLAGVATALLLALAFATQARNQIYRNEVAFWTDVTENNHGNARAYNNLGYALGHSGQPLAALAAYDEALRLAPDDFKARWNRRALCLNNAMRNPSEIAARCYANQPLAGAQPVSFPNPNFSTR